MGVFLAKFFSGFAFWKGEVIGKLIYFSIIAVIVIFVWGKITEPKQESNIQSAEVVNIIQPKKTNAGFFGVKLWRVRFGITVE